MRSKVHEIIVGYSPFVEEIIKGEKSLFYGIACLLLEIFTARGMNIDFKNSKSNYSSDQQQNFASNVMLLK